VKTAPRVRIRIILPAGGAIGPGKADLLAGIQEHGSIAAAGRAMAMSYQRAWSLIDQLNRTFREPVVTVFRGGAKRGGAQLTATGARVLDSYRAIERVTASQGRSELKELARLEKSQTPP